MAGGIPTRPTAPKPKPGSVTAKPSLPKPAAPKPGATAGTAGTAGGTGDSSYDKYVREQKSQQAKADRKETKQARAQVDKLRNQNSSLTAQAQSLMKALGSKGFKKALKTNLANVARIERQQLGLLMEGYTDRLGGLKGNARDNESAAADSSFANLTNRNRERLSAVTEALSQGAGESDLLAAQAMALRNWSSNQGEVNRSFFDGLRSVNSSLTDLNSDTKNARANIEIDANSNRDKLWGNYYSQQSETQTQLGNLWGQIGANKSDIKGILGNKETGAYSGKGAKTAGKGAKAASATAGKSFNQAAATSGKAWKNPGVSAATMNWEGAAPIVGKMNNTALDQENIEGAEKKPKRPEGARLRSWRD